MATTPAALLSKWTAARLDALGVDSVFAPYILAMLSDSDNPDDVTFNIHQVLMGWLSPEDEDKAHAFVDALVQFHASPSLLVADEAAAASASAPPLGYEDNSENDADVDARMNKLAQSIISDDDDDDDDAINNRRRRVASLLRTATASRAFAPRGLDAFVTDDQELKADAPLFVPGSNATKYTPPNSPGDDSDNSDDDDDAYAYDNGALAYNYDSDDGNDAGNDDADEQHDDDDDAALVDEDAFFWSVAFELVAHLQLKFPDVDAVRIGELLRLVALDNDKAHAVLRATLAREAIGTHQVCRHYLAGDCRRADCMFLHETHAITCRFWLRGACLQDDNCVFAHAFCAFYVLDPAQLTRREYDSEDDEGEDDNATLDFQAEDMFPSLQRNNTATAELMTSSPDTATDLTMNFARAVSLEPPLASTTSSSAWGTTPSTMRPSRAATTIQRPLSQNDVYRNGRWVATGAATASQYQTLREDAYQCACARNKCFMGATQAYRSGNRALAKRLSIQGHELNAQMKQLHLVAAQTIFDARNSSSQLYSDHVMDLHGLHVAEAVALLGAMLPTLAADGVVQMYVVTGSGHHSKGPQANARLLPAVEQFLGAEGYRFVPVADSRGFVGMVLVDLQW